MNPVTLKPATLSDAPLVAALHVGSWREFYRGILPDAYLEGPIVDERRAAWEDRLTSARPDRQLVVLALDNATPVGFVCVLVEEEPERGALLDNLHVSSSHQGRGIGRMLFARAAQWSASTQPGRPMHLWVFEANHQARRFYDSLGGKVVDKQPKHIAGVEVPSLCYEWSDPGKAGKNFVRAPLSSGERGESPNTDG